jgi:hypothetical protein
MCRTASPSESGLAAFDDDVQGWQRRAAGGADPSSICGEVACLSSPFPCDDVDGAVDAKCDHGHGVRPDRPSGRVVASQLVICSPGFARRSRATCQEVVPDSSPTSDRSRSGARSCVIALLLRGFCIYGRRTELEGDRTLQRCQ